MPKVKVVESYNPTKQQVNDAMFCNKRNIAYCMSKGFVDDEEQGYFWIEQYDCSKPLVRGRFLRADLNLPFSFENRLQLTAMEAWKRIFDLYRMERAIIESKFIPKKETVVTEEKPKQIDKEKTLSYNPKREKPGKYEDYGLDLFDLIEEAEKENAEKAMNESN